MEQRHSRSKAFLRNAADFLWPPRSLVSRERGLGKGPLAPHEFSQIHFLSGAVCNRCGAPLGSELDEGATCAVCIARPPRRDRARAAAGADFHEIHIDADVATCESRDPKGLYKKARAGEIKEFTGISAPYEAPDAAELTVDTSDLSIDESVARVSAYVDRTFTQT